ncbi:MAG: nucleotide exchange factor GrpE [Synergistaceae bacterium]|jgi:molecular chaperone GrpE|nr:nucleotide exchange factor GrpE [Synergistaceae bacterium]
MFGFFTKAEIENQLRQDVLSGVEAICAKEISSVKDSFKSSLDSLSEELSSLAERFSRVEEWEQQAQRQDRRRQTALETLLENQIKILEGLKSSPPLEALEALAENLTLACLARPGDREFSILYGKLTDLLACFGLSLVADEGEQFDPEKHEACAARCNHAYPEDSVLEVVRPGFLQKGKVLRCATVVVNRYDAEPEEELCERSVVDPPMLYRNQTAAWEGKLYD